MEGSYSDPNEEEINPHLNSDTDDLSEQIGCLPKLIACCFSLCCLVICTPCVALCCCCSAGSLVVNKAQGKRWDVKQRKWVVDNLEKDEATLKGLSNDDDDILNLDEEGGGGASGANVDTKSSSAAAGTVKETEYYDTLGVPPDADENKIKRSYYVGARKWHPDRNDSEEAEAMFQEIGEAYQVLSNPELRAAYDTNGKEGLSGDKTGVSLDSVDPALIFTFLFGSDAFTGIIGRLQLVTNAMVKESSETSVGRKNILELERRRVIRLAINLRERIQGYVDGQEDRARAVWEEEASKLVECRYGEEILNIVGAIYRVVATQLEGTWSEGVDAKSTEQKIKRDAAGNLMKGFQELGGAGTDSPGQDSLPTYIELMWNVTVIDITGTIREVVTKVVSDRSVTSDVQKKRAKAIRAVGDIFEKKKSAKKNEQQSRTGLFQSAAAAAMEQTLEKMREDEMDAPPEGGENAYA